MAGFLRRAAARASAFMSSFSSGADDRDGDEDAPGGFAMRREVAVDAPRVPLITLAVSMFGGAALGAVQGLEWFASLLREDDDGDTADEFLIEAACAQEEPAGARGALRTLPVSRCPRPVPCWTRVVGGWPLCAEVAT